MSQEQINKIKAKLAKAKRGTPEYKALLQQFNTAREAMGRGALTAKQAQSKTTNFANKPAGKKPAKKPKDSSPVAGHNLNSPKGIIDAELDIQDDIADKNVQLGSPGTQTNPFGTQNITRDADGNIIVDQQLSGAQQGILDRDQNLSTMGRDAASNMFGGYVDNLQNRTLGSDLIGDRNRMEDEVFQRLTRGMGEQKGRDQQQLEQTLHNRGIPVGSALFNQQMEQFNKSYGDRELDARAQATQMGGQEYERSFNMQEGLLKNQLGELGYLAQFGSGLQLPQFQGYQGVQQQAPSALASKVGIMGAKDNRTALEIQREQLEIERGKLDLQGQALAQAARPSGGQAPPKSPFNSTLPPGAGGR